MSMLDYQTVPLSGMNIIEASAGTGKTYTLAELYSRLILEKGLTVDQILVVTYTRAATEELRGRLRQKLVDIRDELLADDDHDIDKRKRLALAIQSFDESAIFTIHGFCQRVLSDYAFESGVQFDLDLVGDDQELLLALVDDFWRKHITTADASLVDYLLAKHQSPERLLNSIKSLIGKPYLKYLPIAEVDFSQIQQRAQSQFETVKRCWQLEQEQVTATLTDKAILNGNKYRANSVEKWLILLQDLLSQQTVPNRLFEGFERFTPAKLEDALKKGMVLPELNFWTACELLNKEVERIKDAQEKQYQQLRYQCLQHLINELPAQKHKHQVQSYDDLLLNLELALTGERGEWLAQRLREQFPAALIDEFQDTDPVQYSSFSRIYANSGLPVFLVGDPKQAIYSFRGADIFTYLQAKASAEEHYTLGTNWRSHPDLVTAVNSLFERQAKPFIYDDISFQAVDAAREEVRVLDCDDEIKSLHFLCAEDSDKALSKQDMTALSASVTADEIAKLLNQAELEDALLVDMETSEKVAISGGDIAVLVRSNKQAQVVQKCLQLRGINSVQQGRDNVFSTTEALMLYRVLLAIAEPQKTGHITAALSTPLWDFDASTLYALQQDENAWSEQVDLFYDLHEIWQRAGFMRAFRHLLNVVSGQKQLLSLPEGERKLTNLLHLAELIQQQASQQDGAIEPILQWFMGRIQSIDPNDETGQLRLESDEQLVNIITIHKSKGLEYPAVFCPFLWDSQLRLHADEVVSFHDADDDYSPYVAFAEPELSHAREINQQEQIAEDLRLLYVALTRARERCVICWGHVRGVEQSALYRLLHSDENDEPQLTADVMELVTAHSEQMSASVMDVTNAVKYESVAGGEEALSAKTFEGTIQTPWRVGSFSALAHGHDAELPDYDFQTISDLVLVGEQQVALDRFGFPKGAQAGTCLHAIFEFMDFQSQDEEQISSLINKTLLQFGFESHWTQPVKEWLSDVLNTELAPGLKLNQLSRQQRLDELSFYFPVAGLAVDSLQAALLPLVTDGTPLARVIEQLHFADLTGFMKGFIDLVFEHDGRYYIVDYKSNYLGQQPEAYQADELEQAMVSHDYPLQYLIYSLALHRYLKLRLTDYDPEQHLGGVYYLFIRGMKHEWGQAGVFYDMPSAVLLDAFDRCLRGEGDD